MQLTQEQKLMMLDAVLNKEGDKMLDIRKSVVEVITGIKAKISEYKREELESRLLSYELALFQRQLRREIKHLVQDLVEVHTLISTE